MAELADALVLGTSVNDVGVQVPSSAPEQSLVELFESLETTNFSRLKFDKNTKILIPTLMGWKFF